MIDQSKNEMQIQEFSKQVRILEDVINKTKTENSNAVIDRISHSQGGVIAGLLKPENISKTILIVLPFSVNIDKMLKNYTSRSGTMINFKDDSRLVRSDGSVSRILGGAKSN